MLKDACSICQLPNRPTEPIGDGSTTHSDATECERCGRFEWDHLASLEGRARLQVKMSGFVRDQNTAGITPRLTRELVQYVENLSMPRLKERRLCS